MVTPQRFIEALVSSSRAHELADVDDLFGFLIGSWNIEAILYDSDGKTRKIRGELHASRVLEGRAIQDLFIFPRRADRTANASAQGDRYGTTIRTYDHKLLAWRVNFINPADEETSAQLIARRHGAMIEMEGTLSGGTPIRWHYDSVTPTSFHYGAEKLANGEKSWRPYLELFGIRAES